MSRCVASRTTAALGICLGLLVSASPSRAAPFVYVALTATNNLAAFDGAAGGLGSLGAPIVTGGGPSGVAATPDGKSVYVTNRSDNTVSQYTVNAATGALTAKAPPTVAGGSDPLAIAVSGDGRRAYTANPGNGTLSEYSIDPASGILIAQTLTVPSGGLPSGIAVGVNGLSLYVTNKMHNWVSQYSVNATTGAVTPKTPATVPAGSGPNGVAVTPDGRHAYVTNLGDNSVTLYAIDASGALTTLPGIPPVAAGASPTALAVTADGKYLYVANAGSNTVSQYSIDATTGALGVLPPAIATGIAPRSLAVSPDGTTVYVTNSGDGTVSQYWIGGTANRPPNIGLFTPGALTPRIPATVHAGPNPQGVIAIAPGSRLNSTAGNGRGGGTSTTGGGGGSRLALRSIKSKHGKLTIAVQTPGAGTVTGVATTSRAGKAQATARRKAQQKTITYGSTSTRATSAGTVTLTINPTKAARRLLKSRRKLNIAVRVAFKPRGGGRARIATGHAIATP